MDNICFMTTIHNNYKSTFSNPQKALYVQNGFSYIYSHLSKEYDFILVDANKFYEDNNYKRCIIENIQKYDKIYLTIYFFKVLIKLQKILDLPVNFYIGGPGIELELFYKFYGKYSEIYLKKNNVNFLNCSISEYFLGFESSEFMCYWDNIADITYSKYDKIVVSLPLEYKFCMKSLKYGPCSFCSFTPKFMNYTKKIIRSTEDIIYNLFEKDINLIFFKKTYNIPKFFHIGGSGITYLQYRHVYDSLKQYKQKILDYNINFILYTTFLDIDKILNYSEDLNINNKMVLSISLESLSDQDLYIMNKDYVSFINIIKYLELLLKKQFNFNTSLIINNNPYIIYDKEYIDKYIYKFKKICEIIQKYSKSNVIIHCTLLYMSYDNSLVNNNLDNEKNLNGMKKLIKNMINITGPIKNLKLSILRY